MNKDIETSLKNKFPSLFKKLCRTSKARTRLPLPIELFGIECGDGWFSLLYSLCEKLENEINKLPKSSRKDYYFVQIKEKYGCLVAYLSNETSEMLDLLNDAENQSETICEICGKDGKLTGSHWLSVRCPSCLKQKL